MPRFITNYPKLLLLACSFAFAYLLYHAGYFDVLEERLNGHGYVSVFLGGLLFSFGFTAPFGIALFVEIAHHVNPFLAAPIAGIGALLMDLAIFELMRFSLFHDELRRLRKSSIIAGLHRFLHGDSVPVRLREYLLWSFAGIVIASPLPDELGVSLVSGITDVDSRKFSVLCFVMNTIGVLVILLLAR